MRTGLVGEHRYGWTIQYVVLDVLSRDRYGKTYSTPLAQAAGIPAAEM